MVVLQNDPAALTMASRVVARPRLDFDSARPLEFEIRSIKDMANRPYNFESFRMLHYDIIIEDAVTSRDKAKELNILGVKYYKEGKFDEAQWNFEKALSIDPSYENAKKNLDTLNAKMEARKDRMSKEAKEGKSFAEVSREITAESGQAAPPADDYASQYTQAYRKDAVEQPRYPASDYQQAQYTQRGYQQAAYQQNQYQQAQYQQAQYQQAQYQQAGSRQQVPYGQPSSAGVYYPKNYRCPGCGIPVKPDWVMCTNCGTDLRQYPPIPY